jgi:hypothetical protein
VGCPTTHPEYEDLSQEEATRRVVNGDALLVLGLAGTGKSHYARDLVSRLRAQGLKVECMAKTHVAAQRIQGVTCDHWVRRHVLNGHSEAQVLWVDEVFQVDVAVLAQLNKLTRTNTRFLLTGDPHQFEPLANSWRGCAVGPGRLENSRLLRHLAGGHRLTLTVCLRSDVRLFSFYASLVHGERPLAECIAAAREQFGLRGHAEHNLVISHRRRVSINRRLNRAAKPAEGAVWVPVALVRSDMNEAQSMWLWPGLRMLGCCHAERDGLRNGVTYTLEAVDAEGVTIAGQRVPMEVVKRHLRLAHCQTYASCQGTEFTGTLRLWDAESPHFTRRHLYVGLSRARAATAVVVA